MRSSILLSRSLRGLCFSAAVLAVPGLSGAAPFTTATVTKVENKVYLGDRGAANAQKRLAAAHDVMQAQNYLLSESDSRAEIQYPDGTLVRIGQNTVYSFNSESRTLALDRGSLLFHMPKGAGGGVIKTASLTAAITGTAGKISDNYIAITEGEVKLVPSGRIVHAGEFARRNADGSITIAPYDPAKINDGLLVEWHGHMPGFPERLLAGGSSTPVVLPQDVRYLEVLTRTQNQPGSINRFFPVHHEEPKKKNDDNNNPTPTPAQSTPFPRPPGSPGSSPGKPVSSPTGLRIQR